MAPESPNQKRKRGRPPGASAPETAASDRGLRRQKGPAVPDDTAAAQNEQNQETGAVARPNKRRRQAEEEQAPPLENATASQVRKSKRKAPEEPQASSSQPAEGDASRSGSSLRRSTRDRNSGDGTPWWEVSGLASASKQPRAEKEAPPAPQQKRKRAPPPSTAESAPDAQPKRRGRPSMNEAAPETTSEEPVPKRRRARTSALDKPPAAENNEPKTKTTAKAKPRTSEGSARPSRGNRQRDVEPEAAEPRASAAEAKKAANVLKRKRRKSDRDEADESRSGARKAEPAAVVPKYRHLVSRTRLVPRSTMSAKWSPLDMGAINAVTALLADSEKPVLSRLRDSERRREHAQSALSAVTRRVRSKLAKGIRFPPASHVSRSSASGTKSGHEDDFNFERIIDSIQSLERQLNPLLHSVVLLTKEKVKEEKALDADYATLRELETNAQAETRTWRERMKKSHALAPDIRKDQPNHEGSFKTLQILPPENKVRGGAFEGLQDEELVALSQQIGNHMESLRGNLHQIEGIVPAITSSKAALQEVLHRHLEPRQYEQVLLG